METSNFLSVDARDLGKGLIVSVGGALVSGIYSAIQAGLATAHVTVNWSLIGLTALSAGLSYIGKQFFTAGTVVTPKQ